MSSTERIRSLIIEDDVFMIDLLRDKLKQYHPEVEVLAATREGAEGLKLIKEHHPDLIFLDVELGDMTGFEMLAQVQHLDFETIFVTSYSHYAIKAIRFNALDYLVKPIDLQELKQAMERYKLNEAKEASKANVQRAVRNQQEQDVGEHELVLHTHDGDLYLRIKDIVRIEGERNYSFVILKNKKKHLVSKTLADLEDLLEGKSFFRSHRSYLVNGMHIASHNNTMISLSDGTEVPIARRKKEEFKEWVRMKFS
ncbi:MAG: LytTR family DNA-binding domain-containing protein [Bacteroidota bacterium]